VRFTSGRLWHDGGATAVVLLLLQRAKVGEWERKWKRTPRRRLGALYHHRQVVGVAAVAAACRPHGAHGLGSIGHDAERAWEWGGGGQARSGRLRLVG